MNLLKEVEQNLIEISNSRKDCVAEESIPKLRKGALESIREVILHIGCNPHAGYFDMDRYFEKRSDHGDNCFDIWVSEEEKEKAQKSNTLWYLEVMDDLGIVPILGRYYASNFAAVVAHFIKANKDE